MPKFQGPVLIAKRQGSTNDGSAPTNNNSITLGDNTGATTVSQEFYIYQNAAVAGNEPFYEVGVAGTTYLGGAISIPNAGNASAQVIETIPAGSRIQNITLNLLQAPTAITTGVLTFALNGTTIGTIAIGAGLGNGTIVWANSLAALRLLAFVGTTDAVITAALSGTGITGGILAEISVQYTVRRGDGSITPVGQGLTIDGTNSADIA